MSQPMRGLAAAVASFATTTALFGQEPVAAPIAPVVPIVTAPIAGEQAAPMPAAGAPAAPIAEAQAVAPGCATSLCGPYDFSKVPPIRPALRTGPFQVAPTGCGSYSLMSAWKGETSDGPPKFGYPAFGFMANSFYDTDWRYLDNPKTPPKDIFDEMKRMRIGDDWLFSTGGSAWTRLMNETNSRLTQGDNNYVLNRARVYADLWYEDRFRVFVEGIFSYSMWQDLPKLPIDENRYDFLNLFIDLKLATIEGEPLYLRAGRQELAFGSQRLISTLDWANTRRTFQGLSLNRTSETFDFSMFWVQPVIPNPVHLDSVDNNQNFAGAWATYKPKKGTSVDLYYLMLDNTNEVVQQRVTRAPYTLHTIGSRYAGDMDKEFLWDFEGAMQLGNRNGNNVVAGMGTAGLGYHFKDVAWEPTLWAFYDYASGGTAGPGGTEHTFNALFPFGHYYLGWADLVGRQNIQDLNAHLYLYPSKWITMWAQYHCFWLANSQDALYNAAGNAIRRDATGAAGSHVGNELDLVVNFHLTPRSDLTLGYSHLFGGNFLKATSGVNAAQNSSMFFAQSGFRW
ncbi:MAG: alginate export family protein [Gemmataceae bacterium]